jgi:hypothetical protein
MEQQRLDANWTDLAQFEAKESARYFRNLDTKSPISDATNKEEAWPQSGGRIGKARDARMASHTAGDNQIRPGLERSRRLASTA